jgi:hypothetical protein
MGIAAAPLLRRHSHRGHQPGLHLAAQQADRPGEKVQRGHRLALASFSSSRSAAWSTRPAAAVGLQIALGRKAKRARLDVGDDGDLVGR